MSVEVLERPRDATVEGSMLFLEPPKDGKPVVEFTYGAGEGTVTAVYAPRRVTIRDARTIAADLDAEGFELVPHRSRVRDFSDEAQAGGLARDEAAALVRSVTGASRVVVFDHTLRRRSPDAVRQPSTRVHNDYTERSAPQRVRDLLADEADVLLGKRFALINVWRPIRHAAQDWPLAIADARTMRPEHLISTDIVYPDRRGEIYGLVQSPEQRWWYYPNMQLNEALLIKCYDSDASRAQFTPHTAFESPLTPANAPPRESIEFRTIAFFD
ncbi:CmcJ/NvfI family oxidoreductase [Terricaulis silvestris]|uniref:Methyltransferase n=1 Tax=Terricaulis silvestris TaxID=2686094 RepID=A0A6I6MXJ4_9CAUL|nr:CmcJ/NvfI family oxidoreductase [Terricaulis silvestris]QGZ95913.1 hypothetical protein DSM104635_02768 [Terricaulis silvestris]